MDQNQSLTGQEIKKVRDTGERYSSSVNKLEAERSSDTCNEIKL